MNEIAALMKESDRGGQPFHHMGTEQDATLGAESKLSTDTDCWNIDFGLFSFQTERNKLLLSFSYPV